MNTELKEIENSLNILEANQKQIKLLRNKASYITNKLDTFENNYIKSNWIRPHEIFSWSQRYRDVFLLVEK